MTQCNAFLCVCRCAVDIVQDVEYAERQLKKLQPVTSTQNIEKIQRELKSALAAREEEKARGWSPKNRSKRVTPQLPVHVEKIEVTRADNSPSMARFKEGRTAADAATPAMSGARMQQLLLKQRDFAQDAVQREMDAHISLTGELAEMTHQLKGHSQLIHETIRAQNLQLDELKVHSSLNLETMNVQRAQLKQRQKNMSMSIMTSISVAVTLLVVFAFTYIIIRTFPRSSGWLM